MLDTVDIKDIELIANNVHLCNIKLLNLCKASNILMR